MHDDEARRQGALREGLTHELRGLGLEVAPEDVTITTDDGDGLLGAEYVIGEARFALDDHRTGLALWLTCPRCGAQVEAGPVSSPLSLGAMLADEKGAIARGHRCPPEGMGDEPGSPPQPCEQVAVGLRLVVDGASVTPR